MIQEQELSERKLKILQDRRAGGFQNNFQVHGSELKFSNHS